MRNIFNKKIISFLLIVCFGVFIFSPVVNAQDPKTTEYGLQQTLEVKKQEAGGNKALSEILLKGDNLPEQIGTIIGVALAFIGLLFFILIVYAGFLYMTARGNEEQVKQALDYIYQAIIGLVIVASAYLVTKYIGEAVINSFTT